MAETVKNAANSAVEAVKNTIATPAPPSDQYLLWNASGVEIVRPDEESKSAEIADVMNKMQQRNFTKHRKAFRATHVKVQGIVKGKLEVPSDLPQHLRQGMFAEPGKVYDVAARYANEPYLLQPDQEPGPRGMSMKVFGVTGPRLEGVDSSVSSQDWFFNNAPSIELTDIDTTLEIMSLREQHFDEPNMLGAKLKLRKDLVKQHAPYTLPNTNIASHSFFTQSAYRYGDYYGHMGLFPVLDSQLHRENETVQKDHGADILSDWLQDYFGSNEAKYEFRIQLGTDPKHHPTEDGSVVWDEKTAPYQTIATVTFPKQNSFAPARRAYWEDQMLLSPWKGLEAHRPLGSINRLRKYVYARSHSKRDEINAETSHDVERADQIPD